MDASLTRDVWSAIAPEIETPRLKRLVALGNRDIPMSRPDEGMIAVWALAHEYLRNPPPAQFKFLVSPLIMWIWIGGLIVFGGGLLALTPPLRLPRRARVYARARTRRGAPASQRRVGAGTGEAAVPGLAALEAAREVKYRELRELELDYGTGKLSREDYEETGGALRAEALAILDRIESLGDRRAASDQAATGGPGGAGTPGDAETGEAEVPATVG
jgi:hypothetical protein